MAACPPGVICIENGAFLVAIIALAIVVAAAVYRGRPTAPAERVIVREVAPRPMPRIALTPINIRTQGVPGPYQQVGLLRGGGEILPLIGRELNAGRSDWNYYTTSNQRSMVRLPVSHKGKACGSERGCHEIYDGDEVFVDGYQSVFKATIYEKENPRYIPTVY